MQESEESNDNANCRRYSAPAVPLKQDDNRADNRDNSYNIDNKGAATAAGRKRLSKLYLLYELSVVQIVPGSFSSMLYK